MTLADPASMAISRRRSLKLSCGVALAAGMSVPRVYAVSAQEQGAKSQHFPFGPVVPARALSALPVRTHLGAATDLASLLRGHVSAVQLMFTGCSATCPIQGALFAQAQALLGARLPNAQFVSLSIDPLSDTPVALARWLARLDARPGWLAAVPRLEDVERLNSLLDTGGEPRPRGTDPHTGQVYIVNSRGELVFRTASMPPPARINEALDRVAALG